MVRFSRRLHHRHSFHSRIGYGCRIPPRLDRLRWREHLLLRRLNFRSLSTAPPSPCRQTERGECPGNDRRPHGNSNVYDQRLACRSLENYKESESNPSGLLTLIAITSTMPGTYMPVITVGSSGQTASVAFTLVISAAADHFPGTE